MLYDERFLNDLEDWVELELADTNTGTNDYLTVFVKYVRCLTQWTYCVCLVTGFFSLSCCLERPSGWCRYFYQPDSVYVSKTNFQRKECFQRSLLFKTSAAFKEDITSQKVKYNRATEYHPATVAAMFLVFETPCSHYRISSSHPSSHVSDGRASHRQQLLEGSHPGSSLGYKHTTMRIKRRASLFSDLEFKKEDDVLRNQRERQSSRQNLSGTDRREKENHRGEPEQETESGTQGIIGESPGRDVAQCPAHTHQAKSIVEHNSACDELDTRYILLKSLQPVKEGRHPGLEGRAYLNRELREIPCQPCLVQQLNLGLWANGSPTTFKDHGRGR
ncbi:hypothetical protein RRG08_064493 [Elysia crispata]|uniref:Uncharacterized protein n=1 Tax=Elysia crispata TaxID=231223 RepID=A0AAE1AE89_9GAST|nr:hypothetical protein RRG08_064493 [Elysia crispata]